MWSLVSSTLPSRFSRVIFPIPNKIFFLLTASNQNSKLLHNITLKFQRRFLLFHFIQIFFSFPILFFSVCFSFLKSQIKFLRKSQTIRQNFLSLFSHQLQIFNFFSNRESFPLLTTLLFNALRTTICAGWTRLTQKLSSFGLNHYQIIFGNISAMVDFIFHVFFVWCRVQQASRNAIHIFVYF